MTRAILIILIHAQFLFSNLALAETWFQRALFKISSKSNQKPIGGFTPEILLQPNPSLNDLLRLWYPEEQKINVGYTLDHCLDRNGFPAKRLDSALAEGCSPDTLYSWGASEKTMSLEKIMGEGPWLDRLERPIYLSQSPSATFAYGEDSIRIKLKDGVRFQVGSRLSCMSSDAVNTVYFHVWGDREYGGLDYIICSPQVISSWSYGTKRHYDEIIKDISWILDPKHTQNDYSVYAWVKHKKAYLNDWWDGHNFSEEILEKNLKRHLDKIVANAGKIFFNPSESRDSKKHFQTRLPIYYNEE